MSAQTTIFVEGMTCSSCARNVSNAIEKSGMHDVMVDVAKGEATFTLTEASTINEVVRSINRAGYKATLSKGQFFTGRFSQTELYFLICLIFTIPLLLHMVISNSVLHNGFVQLFLATPVLIIGLKVYGKSAIGSIRSGSPNMDVLIMTGALASFLHSIISLILADHHHHEVLYFETGASIITLVMLGNIIEHRAIKSTSQTIDQLSHLQPMKAKLVTGAGTEKESIHEMDAKSIVRGDTILVNEGELVPADGLVKWGNGFTDESMLTGESRLVVKKPGDTIFAGTTLAKGTLKIRAEKGSDKTVLAGIIELIKKSQSQKPKIQRLGDRISAVFVPVVIGVALITFLASYFIVELEFAVALQHSIAVLVVACPCAMGLATPTAIAVAIGRAAKKGVLIKSATSIEAMAHISTIVFDKTGTLTNPDLSISNFKIGHQFNEEHVNAILVSMTSHSSHPVSLAIFNQLKDFVKHKIAIENVIEVKGRGLQCYDDKGNLYKLGNADFTGISDQGGNNFLTINGQLAASFFINSEIKSGALQMVEHFNFEKVNTIILSGDNEIATEKVRKEVHAKSMYSGKLPQEKLEIIKSISAKETVAMVGDGINDAAPLAVADVAISISNASQIAVNQAQVVLLAGGELEKLQWLHGYSRHTLSVIKQNLLWALIYNMITIPLAAYGVIPPSFAALSMALSDVVVIGNSLRLRGF